MNQEGDDFFTMQVVFVIAVYDVIENLYSSKMDICGMNNYFLDLSLILIQRLPHL